MAPVLKISVVAPNLNESRFLPGFLDSLRAQSFQNFETIVVDGGSVDGSLQILEDYRRRGMQLKILIDRTRNIGYVRNVGSRRAQGDVIFHTSTDTWFAPDLLERVDRFYMENPGLISMSGRTFPMEKTGVLGCLAYGAFDLWRYLFTVLPRPIHKYRPGGNFTTIRNDMFRALGGFPEVTINEDGLLGERIDAYVYQLSDGRKRLVFHLGLYVGHHAKRFEMKGGVRALSMYFYVFANMLPFLRPLFRHIERRSAEVFCSRSDLGASRHV
jgi:glycosyltransferase involved in cell wall biosynthesis